VGEEWHLAEIRALLDRHAIVDCMMRYARGVDRLDRELVVSAFHPDAVIDQGMFVGSPVRFADWALSMHERLHESHQHFVMNHL
jgi:SnoaL-like domain